MDGIKFEESVLPAVDESHGWFPESLRVKEQCWTSTTTTTVTSNERGGGGGGLKPLSRPVTQSSVRKMESVGSIPVTIPESTNEEQTLLEGSLLKKDDKPKSVLMATKQTSIKPAKSITDLPTPNSNNGNNKGVLTVKRVHSTSSIYSNKSKFIVIIIINSAVVVGPSRVLQKSPSITSTTHSKANDSTSKLKVKIIIMIKYDYIMLC